MDAFSVRTKIMIGGGMDALAQRLHRVFLVTDKFMAESGKTNYVTDRLLRSGGEFKIFSDVQADPDIATVTRGVEQILEFQPDAVVAFGGGSAIDAITIVKRSHPKSIKFLCVIAAPEGLEALTKAHPDVHIYCAAVDECLNENGYILPGLGDAGDRIFGTL